MRPITRIRSISEAERQTLLKGAKSPSGFTVRRSHILLLSAEGLTPQQIATRLHCGDQTVRNVVRAFAREGLSCLVQKSSRPHHDHRAFDAQGLQRLGDLLHQSPRKFGLDTSQWTLVQLADVCFRAGIVTRPISYETVRQGLHKLGIHWKQARRRITSHDPQYAAKKAARGADCVG
jgi:transposase